MTNAIQISDDEYHSDFRWQILFTFRLPFRFAARNQRHHLSTICTYLMFPLRQKISWPSSVFQWKRKNLPPTQLTLRSRDIEHGVINYFISCQNWCQLAAFSSDTCKCNINCFPNVNGHWCKQMILHSNFNSFSNVIVNALLPWLGFISATPFKIMCFDASIS
jgi:hypothetical protein